MVLHGTYLKPDYLKNGPRKYEEPEFKAEEEKPVKLVKNTEKKDLSLYEDDFNSSSDEEETLSGQSINNLLEKLLKLEEENNN